MSTSASIAFLFSGEDKTAQVFNSIQARAKKTVGSLKSVMRAAGLGLSIAGIAAAAKNAVVGMDKIHDSATRAGAESANEFNKLSMVLKNSLGTVDMDSLSTAMQRMTKATGAVGVSGFKDMLADIAAVSDEQKRLQLQMEIFGRDISGKFAPLVRQGPDALRESLESAMAGMPELSDESIAAADRISGSFTMAYDDMKTSWQGFIANYVAGLEDTFGMKFENMIITATGYIKWFGSLFTETIKTLGANIGEWIFWFENSWQDALAWVLNAVKAVCKGIIQVFVHAFFLVLEAFASLTRRLWNKIINGEDIDWSGFADQMLTSFADSIEFIRDDFKKTIGEIESPEIQWHSTNYEALANARDASIATRKEALDAVNSLAQGAEEVVGDLPEKAKKVAKTVKEAFSASDASSYDFIKAVYGRSPGDMSIGGATIDAEKSDNEDVVKAIDELRKSNNDTKTVLRDINFKLQALGVF